MPTLPLLKDFFRVTPIFRQSICFGQGYKVLMPVQFPSDFAVSNFLEIEISDLVKGLFRSLFCMHGVEVPIDPLTVVKVFITEKVKLVATDFVGLANDMFDLLGKALAQQL